MPRTSEFKKNDTQPLVQTKIVDNFNPGVNPAEIPVLDQYIDFSQEYAPFNGVVRGGEDGVPSKPIQRRLRIEVDKRKPFELNQEDGNEITIVNLRRVVISKIGFKHRDKVDRIRALHEIFELVRSDEEHIHTLESLGDYILRMQGLDVQPERNFQDEERAKLEQRLSKEDGWKKAENEPVFVVRTHDGDDGEIKFDWGNEYSAGIPTVRVSDIGTSSGQHSAVKNAFDRVGGHTRHQNRPYYVYAIWPGDPIVYRNSSDTKGIERLVLGSLMEQRCKHVGNKLTGQRIKNAVVDLMKEYQKYQAELEEKN